MKTTKHYDIPVYDICISTEKADCTITMGDEDLLGLMTGTLNAQKVS